MAGARHWKSAIRCLALGMAGWFGVAGAPAQQPAGERAVPRISPQRDADDGRPGSGTPADELLPPLPDDFPHEPPRKTPPSSVAIPLPPDIPPLGLPSDGEIAPSFPDLPDLPESSLIPQNPDDEGAEGSAFLEDPDPDGEALRPPAARRSRPGAVLPAPVPGELPFPVWHESPRKARDLAQSENRCLLLVFSSSTGEAGGASKQLSDEVLSTAAFNEFALQHLVICGLFYTKSSQLDLKDPSKIARLDAMEAFKKSFKVRGFPCVILCGPDGKEIRRWTGYATGRGQAVGQQICQAVEGHEAVLFAAERRRETLATNGYRTWTSAHGTTLFAKLLEFDAHSALLRGEDGSERKVRLKQLSLPDREIITRKRLGKPLPEVARPATGFESLTLK